MSDISVAVCTRNRAMALARLLHSLAQLRCEPFEIVVIDNASDGDTTRRVVMQSRFRTLRYIHESTLGLDFARNRALREARGEVVAFIDDDAVADPNWTCAIREAFDDNPALGVCTGKVVPLSLDEPGQRLFEASGGLGRGDRRTYVSPATRHETGQRWPPLIALSIGLGVGCNLAVRRSLAVDLGGFDEALDLGQLLPGGGDTDMLRRVLDRGHDVLYEPGAVVAHEHRATVHDASRQITGHHKATIAMLTHAAWVSRGRTQLEVLAFLLWRLIKPGVRLLRRAAGRDPLPARLLWRVWGHSLAGLIAYPFARRMAEQRKGR